MLITDGADSTCKIWDLSNPNKIPLDVYYDTETAIVSSDYRDYDNLHICVDEDGNFVIRNVKDEKECFKTKLNNHNFRLVKINPLNHYQYFISTKDTFKIYDFRNNLEVDSISELSDSFEVFNDSKQYLSIKGDSMELYKINTGVLGKHRDWKEFGEITHANINTTNYMSLDCIVLGNDTGDIFYSN